MASSSPVTKVLAAALLCAALVAFSVAYVDRPVTAWVFTHILNQANQRWMFFFQVMASPSLIPVPCACFYLAFYAIQRSLSRPPGRFTELWLSISIAVSIATVVKDELKWLFGRPWPGTWVKYGAYNLEPFSSNAIFGGFPSGHTTYIAAPMFVLWWRLPQYRPLWLALIAMVMVGLVASGYHFVGDVIAGCFLGLAAAAGTLAVRKQQPVYSKKILNTSPTIKNVGGVVSVQNPD